MKILAKELIGNIVSRNSHAVDIFDNFGMDYCCQSGLSLEEACRTHEKRGTHALSLRSKNGKAGTGRKIY